MERKILPRLRQLDFANMDGFSAVPQQNFLSFGLLLRRSDSHPDHQAIRFRKVLQSPNPLSPQPPTRQQYRHRAYDDPDQNREDADGEGPHAPYDEIKRHGDPGDATGDAADDGIRDEHVVFAD